MFPSDTVGADSQAAEALSNVRVQGSAPVIEPRPGFWMYKGE
jgi:hypothetical protein